MSLDVHKMVSFMTGYLFCDINISAVKEKTYQQTITMGEQRRSQKVR